MLKTGKMNKDNLGEIPKEYDKMKEAFDDEGKLIEGKEFDPNNEMSSEDKLKFAQDMIAYQENVRKEEESLLNKINNHNEDSQSMSRRNKRVKLKRVIDGYKRHMKTKPKVDINDNDQKSFEKMIEIRAWHTQKNSHENLIVRYGSQKKLDDVKKLLESIS